MNTVTQHEFDVVLNHVYGDAITASRIICGALWLDQVDGDWWSEARFDLSTFNISHPRRCVLGQVVKGECATGKEVNFNDAVYENRQQLERKQRVLGLNAAKYVIPLAVAQTLGFHLLDEDLSNWTHVMNRGWYALIAHRQGKPTINPSEEPDDE